MMKPTIKSISFEGRQAGGPLVQNDFLYDPEENAQSAWVNDPSKDFNVFFKDMAIKKEPIVGSVSIFWTDSVRATFPLPIPEVFQTLNTLGDLIEYVAELMVRFGGFSQAAPGEDYMLTIAERVARMPANLASSDPDSVP